MVIVDATIVFSGAVRHLEHDVDDVEKSTQLDTFDGAMAEMDALATRAKNGGGRGGPLSIYRDQRDLISRVVDGVISENSEQQAQMRGNLVRLANTWMESDDKKLQGRGFSAGFKLERLKLRILDGVTKAFTAESHATSEAVKAQKASGEGRDTGLNAHEIAATIITAMKGVKSEP